MKYKIYSSDVSLLGEVRLSVLCCQMQEAAYMHAGHLGLGHDLLKEQRCAWVLSRQRIQIERLPTWGEEITIRTWPSGRDRLFFYRDFELTDGQGQRVLTASTAWFLIDTEKRERISGEKYAIQYCAFGASVFDKKLERLKNIGEVTSESANQVVYSDLDLNNHVNNVRYIEWVLDTFSPDHYQANRLASLELNYLAEALFGEMISIKTADQKDRHKMHSIVADDRELFRARSSWLSRTESE